MYMKAHFFPQTTRKTHLNSFLEKFQLGWSQVGFKDNSQRIMVYYQKQNVETAP